MGLFHNLSVAKTSAKQQNGIYPIQPEDVVRPIRKHYENELDRSNDANNKVNINMYFEIVATYCAGAAKLILDGDFNALRRLDNKYSGHLEKLDLIIAGTKFDTLQEKEMAEKTLSALKLMRNSTEKGFINVFPVKQEGYKFIENLQTCCEFLAQEKPVECVNKCADYGYFTNIVPILYHQIFDSAFKFNSQQLYCQEILNLYDQIKKREMSMTHRG